MPDIRLAQPADHIIDVFLKLMLCRVAYDACVVAIKGFVWLLCMLSLIVLFRARIVVL